jgi:hypothetical protein
MRPPGLELIGDRRVQRTVPGTIPHRPPCSRSRQSSRSRRERQRTANTGPATKVDVIRARGNCGYSTCALRNWSARWVVRRADLKMTWQEFMGASYTSGQPRRFRCPRNNRNSLARVGRLLSSGRCTGAFDEPICRPTSREARILGIPSRVTSGPRHHALFLSPCLTEANGRSSWL